jgi:hypothetical protein
LAGLRRGREHTWRDFIVMRQLVAVLIAGALAIPLGSAWASTPDPVPREPTRQASPAWDRVVYDRFDSGGVPRHWRKYDGPYGSGPQNCARPSHAFVKDGKLRMVMRHRESGDCGAGWYSAGMKLAERFESVDQKISVRFRVRSVGGVHAHRIIPMRWPSSGDGSTHGEEDYCEGSGLLGCTTFLHDKSGGQMYHRYRVNLTEWHTMTFVRRNFTVSAFFDGRRRWQYRGTRATLPATLKRPVLQQECRSEGCPTGRFGREVILIDWIKVWNPATAS